VDGRSGIGEMTGFGIAGDHNAVHFDSGIFEILSTCLKADSKTMVGAGAKARPTAGFGPSRRQLNFRESFRFRNEQISKALTRWHLGTRGEDLP
jgi:hypothetical protein